MKKALLIASLTTLCLPALGEEANNGPQPGEYVHAFDAFSGDNASTREGQLYQSFLNISDHFDDSCSNLYCGSVYGDIQLLGITCSAKFQGESEDSVTLGTCSWTLVGTNPMHPDIEPDTGLILNDNGVVHCDAFSDGNYKLTSMLDKIGSVEFDGASGEEAIDDFMANEKIFSDKTFSEVIAECVSKLQQ